MSEYRKKPVVIEAHKWEKNGDHPEDQVGEMLEDGSGPRQEGKVVRWFRHPSPAYGGEVAHYACGYTFAEHGWIDTPEGGHTVCPGDWIITGVEGEFYPCKPGIFAATYEPVEDE